MKEAQAREEAFRRAEASCLLEGMDAGADAYYQSVKARVVSGEIDADQMMRLLLDDTEKKYGKTATRFAVAG